MKRFLVFLVVAIAAVSLGLSIYYFTKDNEVIYINSTYITLNKGATIKTDDLLTFEHPSKYTKINYGGVKNTKVLSFNAEEKYYAALTGGETEIVISTSNRQYKSIVIKVVVRDGSEEYPYLIGSQADLLKIGKDSQFTDSTNYELEKSFALNSKWLPIQNFKGTFNGAGYTISNLDISAYTDAQIEASQKTEVVNDVETLVDTEVTTAMRTYNNTLATLTQVGLFETLEDTAVVSDLTLKGVNIVGDFDYIGAIAGVNKGIIKNSTVSTDSRTVVTTTGEGEDAVTTETVIYNEIKSTKANATVGGVVGYNNGSNENTPKLDRVVSKARLVIAANGQNVAGLAGYNKAGKISESYYNGYAFKTVDGTFAGLVGKNEPVSATVEGKTVYFPADVMDCYAIINTQTENAITDAVGVIKQNISINGVEDLYENKIFGNYFSELKTFTTDGSFTATAISAVKNATDISKIGPTCKILSDEQFKVKENFVSYTETGTDYTRYWNFDTVWQMYVEGSVAYPVINPDSIAGSVYDIDVSTVKGSNDIDSNDTPEDIHTLLNNNKTNGSFTIQTDIDLTGFDWTPIAFYNGTLTGATITEVVEGQTITRYPVVKGLTIVLGTENGNAGLFERLGANAIISNLTFEDVTIKGAKEGTIDAVITGKQVGVIAGRNEGANLLNITVNNVTNKLFANQFGTLFGCSYHNEGHSIKNVNVDDVKFVDGVMADYAGGIIGVNGTSKKVGTTITGTEKRGNIPAIYTTVTNFNAIARVLGGVVATNKQGTIKYTDSGINVTITNGNSDFFDADLVPTDGSEYPIRLGGVAGQNSSGLIDYAKASSTITVDTVNGFIIYAGGIAGSNYSGTIAHSYAYKTNITTKRTNDAIVGGIAGVTSGLIELCVVSADCNLAAATSVTKAGNYSFVGGVAGYISLANSKVGAINKSVSYAKTVKGFFAGGIVAYSHGSITYSYANGSEVTGYFVGGITAVLNCYKATKSDGTEVTITTVNNYNSGFCYANYVIANLTSVDNGGETDEIEPHVLYNQVANMEKGATAGFALVLTYGAEVNNCYSAVTMKGGVTYGATIARNTGLNDYNNESHVNERKASFSGVIVNSIYTVKGNDDKNTGGTFVEKADLKVSGNYKTLSNAGLDIDIWDLEEGKYPTIANLDNQIAKFYDYVA